MWRYLILLSFISAPLAGLTSFQPPKPVQPVSPPYPLEFMHQPISGEVVLMAIVDEEGSVGFVEIESATHEAFAENAMIAAYQWKFEPAYDNGKPVRVRTRIPFQFIAPTVYRIFQANINPLVGYEVWINDPARPVPGTNSPKEPNRSIGSAHPTPKRWKEPAKLEKIRIRFLVSPQGNMHNPTLVDDLNPDLYLDAARFLASLDFDPARDSAGNPCWSMAQRIVRFQPPQELE